MQVIYGSLLFFYVFLKMNNQIFIPGSYFYVSRHDLLDCTLLLSFFIKDVYWCIVYEFFDLFSDLAQ